VVVRDTAEQIQIVIMDAASKTVVKSKGDLHRVWEKRGGDPRDPFSVASWNVRIGDIMLSLS